MPDDEVVRRVTDMSRKTGWEAHRLKGFLRFSVMENGVMFAEISPENNCLSYLMEHFADRMNNLPFVIYDRTYKQAGIYSAGRWRIYEADRLTLPDYSADELEYRRMWQCFYDTIAIEGRINHKLRQQMMPKKYQRHILEMQRDKAQIAGVRSEELGMRNFIEEPPFTK
jgi:probable DNA metabolism protein